jgi:hypothetical protein
VATRMTCHQIHLRSLSYGVVNAHTHTIHATVVIHATPHRQRHIWDTRVAIHPHDRARRERSAWACRPRGCRHAAERPVCE